jgi:hypothetical protein
MSLSPSLAFFAAGYEGETQISMGHIAYALKSQVTSDADEDRASPQDDVFRNDSAEQIENQE